MITKNTTKTSAPTRKRTHLKPHQLTVLQNSFTINPLPDGTVRSQLAHDLGVSERTIQIWFQNRRAKARKMEALSNALAMGGAISHGSNNTTAAVNGNGCHPLLPRWTERAPPRYQPTFRTMMTPKRFEELRQQSDTRRPTTTTRAASSKPDENKDHHDVAPRAMSEGMLIAPPSIVASSTTSSSSSSSSSCSSPSSSSTSNNKGPVVSLKAHNLRIGTWTRFAQGHEWDLICEADPALRQMIWQIQAQGHLFRIQVPFDAIQQLTFLDDQLDQCQLQVNVIDPQMLVFSMQRLNIDKEWIRCGDFSEGQQASIEYTHVLQGAAADLQQAMVDLTALVPDLATKIVYTPTLVSTTTAAAAPAGMAMPPPMLDECREFTLSPSATPEPYNLYEMTTTESLFMDKWSAAALDPTAAVYTSMAPQPNMVAPPPPPPAMDLQQYPYGFC
ncbi:hypothetical protein O0I10_000713 [Lichtheimia ornata]|uniref:Homeobox domain-containing protein n=1 Tax=Lichtheimia ornata TaxID=688661 RepID=A0AAD7Y467_9FUNG|nr:uncharacterized protein O0I10_000713 [Lichtheimia ornata]KAJ8663472.1 hypothetical protein O0I10_000713 [Lichtheimia ornata]